MSIRTAVLCVAFGVAAAASPLVSNARVYVDVDVAPPAPRVEVVQAPRPGYIWAPGYWNWSGHDHVWVDGRWEHERHGHHWVADRWVQHGSKWRFEAGHWD
jgi:YXWGXW repeat-containing protein